MSYRQDRALTSKKIIKPICRKKKIRTAYIKQKSKKAGKTTLKKATKSVIVKTEPLYDIDFDFSQIDSSAEYDFDFSLIDSGAEYDFDVEDYDEFDYDYY